jgi:hypothetical protein
MTPAAAVNAAATGYFTEVEMQVSAKVGERTRKTLIGYAFTF